MYKQYRDTMYEVSEEGKVRNIKTKKELSLQNKNGMEGDYQKVSLRINGKRKRVSVHRMVLEAFTYRDDTKEVNHKNCIKSDNRLENLEYCTREENKEHAYKNKINMAQRKIMIGTELKTNKKIEFKSLYQAGKYFTKSPLTEHRINNNCNNIRAVLKGKRKSAFGYYWESIEY